jgi:hypothetical protein
MGAGYPTQTFHVAPATEATHAPQKSQLDAHINDQGGVHGATSVNAPDKLVKRDSNGDIGARNFVGDCAGNANTATNATEHINTVGAVHGATSRNSPGSLMVRDGNGDVAARNFVGDLQGMASVSKQVSDTAPNGGSATLVYGAMAGSDTFRILITGTDDGGWAEIATADNGTEPIFVRQYSGAFTNAVRTLTLLDGNGNTLIPGGLYLYGGTLWIEYGSNSNGTYLRFADGTQICTRSISASLQNPTTHAYAASFSVPPIVVVNNDSNSSAYSSTVNVLSSSFGFLSSTTSNTVKIIAIGRWK